MVFERIIYHEISEFIREKISKQFTGFTRESERKLLFDFYFENVEEDIRSRRVYWDNLHGTKSGF